MNAFVHTKCFVLLLTKFHLVNRLMEMRNGHLGFVRYQSVQLSGDKEPNANWVAAHWTPNTGDKTVLQYDD
ncbi:methionine aminopeptidase 2b [Phtheirospermum japonicum]|uniref:Methionine aminopeptidase 2b n=1 Tax=Phtheirospermum japonicum TaxID=374723 RepID=A0A830BVT8_9LAMI|nr:methionine aminopeptidase 2b [Phtheirospermum japonicum]